MHYGQRNLQCICAAFGVGIGTIAAVVPDKKRLSVENTIRNVSYVASEGMRKTDSEIIKIMLG